MKANFYLREPANEGEDRDKNRTKTAIILFATHSNGRLKYYTGESIKPLNWDFDKQRPKRDVAIKTKLDAIEVAVNVAEAKLIKEGTRVTNTDLKDALIIELKRDKQAQPSTAPVTTLLGLIQRFEHAKKDQLTRGTMLRYKALKHHLETYEAKTNTTVKLSEVNTEFGDAFTSHLFSKGHMRNTAGKLIIGLKVVLNWAVGSGYQVPSHYKKFNIPSSPTKIVPLTETELFQFMTAKVPKHEEITRDLFVFSAWTGLRYSDVVRVTPEMVNGDFLTITPKKTARKSNARELKVYLLPEARAILKKYDYKLTGLRTNQGANKGVKRIAEIAGIDAPVKVSEYFGNRTVDKTVKKWQVLSFHCAKKTYVTLSLKNGVRPEVLSSQVGNTMQTLKPYILIADKDKQTEIGKAFNAIRKKATKLRVA